MVNLNPIANGRKWVNDNPVLMLDANPFANPRSGY